LQGVARGLAFRLYENLGSVPRSMVTQELRAIAQEDRAPLRRLGVRFGAFTIYLPILLKPAAARLKALLWAVSQGIVDIPPPPPAGLTSLQADSSMPAGFYEAAGYRVCGPRAVRIDMLERLGEIIRGKGDNGRMPQAFSVSADMMSVLGCGEEDMALILKSLGFREQRTKNEAGEETVQWLQRSRRDERRPRQSKPAPSQAKSDGERKHEGGKRHEGGRRNQHGPRRERGHEEREDRPKGEHRKPHGKPAPRKPEKPFVVDPDSPFAALAALKFKK
jgi:ATP-dependent RNA helicase SUPV3L1/SUV3